MRIMLLIALLAGVCGAATTAEPLPSMEEMRQLLKDGQHQALLQKTMRVLSLKTADAEKFNYCEVWMLKAEAHLALKQQRQAVEACGEAVNEARSREEAYKAVATELLMSRCKAGRYIPKAGATGPERITGIDIATEDGRKRAFAALFADELAAAARPIAAVQDAQTLAPLLAGIDLVLRLRTVELAATERDDRTRPVLKAMVDRTHHLSSMALRGMAGQIQDISLRANQPVVIRGRGAAYQRPRGASRQEEAALNDIMAACEQIPAMVSELTAALQPEQVGIEALTAEAERVWQLALEVPGADGQVASGGGGGRVTNGGAATPDGNAMDAPVRRSGSGGGPGAAAGGNQRCVTKTSYG